MSFREKEHDQSSEHLDRFSADASSIPRHSERNNTNDCVSDDAVVLKDSQAIPNDSRMPATEEGSPTVNAPSAEEITLATQEIAIAQGRGSFEPVGNALKAIREQRLYQPIYRSFNEYTKKRWEISRRMADYLIQSADVMTNLKSENFCSLPTCEAQVRPLTKIPEALLSQVWSKVIETAKDEKITAALIREVVKECQAAAEEEPKIEEKIALTQEQQQIVKALETLVSYSAGQLRDAICSPQGQYLNLPNQARQLASMLHDTELLNESTEV